MAALIAAPGCSYAFVQEAPATHRRLRHFDCTSSRLPPVLDTAGAGVFVIGAVSSAVSPDSGSDSEDTLLAVGVGLALTAAFALSAAYGYAHTAQCDEAQQLLVQRLARETPPAPAAAPAGGCASDMDCKGTRICVQRACVESAPAAPAPAPQTVPAPSDATVPAPAAPVGADTADPPPLGSQHPQGTKPQ